MDSLDLSSWVVILPSQNLEAKELTEAGYKLSGAQDHLFPTTDFTSICDY
jgi:hypothetical protein